MTTATTSFLAEVTATVSGWATADGYTIRDTGRFEVHTPAGALRAICTDLTEACAAISALRATNGEYSHPWIAFLQTKTEEV